MVEYRTLESSLVIIGCLRYIQDSVTRYRTVPTAALRADNSRIARRNPSARYRHESEQRLQHETIGLPKATLRQSLCAVLAGPIDHLFRCSTVGQEIRRKSIGRITRSLPGYVQSYGFGLYPQHGFRSDVEFYAIRC